MDNFNDNMSQVKEATEKCKTDVTNDFSLLPPLVVTQADTIELSQDITPENGEIKIFESGPLSLIDSSNASSQNDLSTSNLNGTLEGTEVNDMESKYLEEQANLKKTLDELQLKCRGLEMVIVQRDEVIECCEKEKNLLEKEKFVVRIFTCLYLFNLTTI